MSLLVCFVLCQSKVTSEDVNVPFHYAFLDKFVYDFSYNGSENNRGYFEISAATEVEGTYVALFTDEDRSWGAAEQTSDCTTKMSKARWRYHVKPFEVNTKFIYTWGHVRPRFWYLMAFNCNPDANAFGIHLHYTAHWLNLGSPLFREFSVEQQGLVAMTLLFLICFVCGSVLMVNQVIIVNSHRLFHPTFKWLTGACLLQTLALLLYTIHYFDFASNGVGIPFAFYLGEVADVTAEMILISLVVLLAQGWSVDPIQTEIRYKNILCPVGSFFVLFYILLFFSQYWYEDSSSDAGYFFETIPGQMLCLLRAIVCFVLVVTIITTWSTDLNHLRIRFYRKLCMIMSWWLLTLPIMVIIASSLAPYVRFKVVVTMETSMKSVALFSMALLLWPSKTGDGLFSFKSQLRGDLRGVAEKHRGRMGANEDELEMMQQLSSHDATPQLDEVIDDKRRQDEDDRVVVDVLRKKP